jgi:hypothetical protein
MLLIHSLVYTSYKHWLISIYYSHYARGGAAVEAALQTGRSRVRFPIVSLDFFTNIILLVAL